MLVDLIDQVNQLECDLPGDIECEVCDQVDCLYDDLCDDPTFRGPAGEEGPVGP